MFMFMQEYKSNMRAIKLFKHSFVIFKALLALCFMGKLLFKTSQTTSSTSPDKWINIPTLVQRSSPTFESWNLREKITSELGGTNFNFQNSREIKKLTVRDREGQWQTGWEDFGCFYNSELLQVIVTGHRYHYSRDLHNKM